MLKEGLSLSQLLALIISFLPGSAIVVGLGEEAKQDAWIAVLIASFLGLVIMFFYCYMLNLLPGKNLFEIFEFCYSRFVAILLSLIYVLAFLYYASRNIRDFGELITTAILPLTPIQLISLTFSFLILYVIYLGIEVVGRTSEIFLPYVFVFLLLLAFLLIASGGIEISNIQPILGEGIKPIIRAVFPDLLMVPYGELVVFTVILNHVTNTKFNVIVSLIGVFIASTLLIFTTFIIIVSIGVDSIERANFPLMSTARLISIADFLERVDAIIVFLMMLGIFIKAVLFTYGGLKGMEYIFRIPFRFFALPITMLVSIYSLLISENFAEHVSDPSHKKLLNYTHFPFQFIFPVITFLILLWKVKKQKSKKDNGMSY